MISEDIYEAIIIFNNLAKTLRKERIKEGQYLLKEKKLISI